VFRRTVLGLVCLFCITTPLLAADAIDVSIEFVDRRIYHPDSDIHIRVTVKNEDARTYQFRLADRRLFTVDFDVRTLTNVQVERSQNFITRRAADQPVYYRNVSLEPGEEFSFTEELSDYVNVTRAGTYVVQANFYPDLWTRDDSGPIQSNRLTLSVRPSPVGIPEVQHRIDEETEEILHREALPPDEVVRWTLEARQRREWNRFFLYLDTEELLLRDPARERRYKRLPEEEQLEELEQFREHLKQERVEGDLVAAPSSFEIEETRYGPHEGEVITVQRFRYDTFTEVREYRYTLERRDNVWVIVDYTVESLGTE